MKLLFADHSTGVMLLQAPGSIPSSFKVYMAGVTAVPTAVPRAAACLEHPSGGSKRIATANGTCAPPPSSGAGMLDKFPGVLPLGSGTVVPAWGIVLFEACCQRTMLIVQTGYRVAMTKCHGPTQMRALCGTVCASGVSAKAM